MIRRKKIKNLKNLALKSTYIDYKYIKMIFIGVMLVSFTFGWVIFEAMII